MEFPDRGGQCRRQGGETRALNLARGAAWNTGLFRLRER